MGCDHEVIGNKLKQDTLSGTNTYAYDDANHLTTVDGTTYEWDANGNLLSDGVSTYSYDAANRMVGLTQGTTDFEYKYGGLGDRHQQIVSGITPQLHPRSQPIGLALARR